MKNFIIVFMCVFFALSCISCSLNVEKSSENLSSYCINATYDENTHSLVGNMNINFENKYQVNIDNIELNLYDNAFRENSKQEVISSSKYNECYFNGESFGNITISNVQNQNNNPLSYEICGTDENILKVKLDKTVLANENYVFSFDFEINLPNISHRFGYGDNTINFGNIFPILCMFESGTWQEMLYSSNGDPFYSEVANYKVNLTYPEKYVLASTGEEISCEKQNSQKTSVIEAKCVRDFSFVLSEKYSKLSEVVDGICVNYYFYDDEFANKNLETSVNAVKTFNDLFGKYPYKTLNVAKANFCIGGMEFPNLVLIGDTIPDEVNFTYVIVHEIAHQWWYGVVGNNQNKNAWLDESLAEYSTALFFKNNMDYEITYEKIIDNANKSYGTFYKAFSKVFGDVDTSMTRPLDEYKTELEYVYMSYLKGMLMFDSLSQTIGEKTVIKCLKNYYKTYAFKIATPNDLIESFEKTTSCNLKSFFEPWLEGKTLQFCEN